MQDYAMERFALDHIRTMTAEATATRLAQANLPERPSLGSRLASAVRATARRRIESAPSSLGAAQVLRGQSSARQG